MAYDDGRYGANQVMRLRGRAVQTSVRAARVIADKRRFMSSVTIKDWNLLFVAGDTTTGVITAAGYIIGLGKSLGGTGAISLFGTAYCGTQADSSVLDAAVTETDFVAGDDLVLTYEAGTALPLGDIQIEADVSYVEHFVG
jgi:proteasome assembly chaperone (PAC2) family protein